MKNPTYRHIGIPLAGIALFLIALTGGCATASTKSSAPIAATPVKTDDPKLREELRQLDAFFDQNLNATLESDLRQDAARATDAAFLEKYPAWKQLTLNRPSVTDALKSEDHFLLHRALARMAGNVQVELGHLRRFDDFLAGHPAIQVELEQDPARLFSADFLVKYPALAAFFDKHPDLYTVFAANAANKVAAQPPSAD